MSDMFCPRVSLDAKSGDNDPRKEYLICPNLSKGYVRMNQTCEVFVDDSRVPWFRSEAKNIPTVYGRGYAFLNDVFLSGQSLVDGLQARLDRENLECSVMLAKEIIPKLNGCWAILVQWPNGHALAAVDRSRSIPLLYARTPNGYIISNTLKGVATRIGDLVIDKVCALQFLLGKYTSGKQTLFKNVFQVQPGEIVHFDPLSSSMSPTHAQYFTFFPRTIREAADSQLMDEFEQVFESVFRRCAKALEGRIPIISLSGGYDSRAIACMLRKSGVKHALCYTYGIRGHWEIDVAKTVAHELGFDWRFVEYDPMLWQSSMASQEMREYWRYAFGGTSLPVMHTIPALIALRQTDYIRENAVFLSGDLGQWTGRGLKTLCGRSDRPSGECSYTHKNIRNNEVVSTIVHHYLNLWPTRDSSWQVGDLGRVAENIEAEVRSYENYKHDKVSNYMEWQMRNRTALWIVNRQRAFEFFGGDFFLPFGDHEFVDFFRALPLELHLKDQFYCELLMERIFPESIRKIPCSAGHRRMGSVKRYIRDCFQLVGLIKPAEYAWRWIQRTDGLAADTWFTQGRASWNVTIKEALLPYAISEHLPATLLEIIRPLLSSPSYSISWNGLFAAAFLATLYSEQGQSRKVCDGQKL